VRADWLAGWLAGLGWQSPKDFKVIVDPAKLHWMPLHMPRHK
jgi:hypothetical protein